MTSRIVACVMLLAITGCGGEETASPPAATPDPFVQALKKGGLTLVIRHATADANVNQEERLRSCSFQRNLTEAGREQARAIGRGVRALRIPIGDVRASPLCRARDTARLAFGRVTLERDLISPGVIGTEADDRRRARSLRNRGENPPAPGKNTVLVTHTGNLGAAFGAETIQEGETLILGAGAEEVGRVEAERWAALAGG